MGPSLRSAGLQGCASWVASGNIYRSTVLASMPRFGPISAASRPVDVRLGRSRLSGFPERPRYPGRRGKRLARTGPIPKKEMMPKRILPSGVMRALFFQPTKLIDQRLEEGTQMEFAFERLPVLRSVLAAGVIAATFIVQPAVAQSPGALS